MILDATRRLGEGETLFSQEELVELLRLAGQNREEELEARVSIEQITPREREVLRSLAEGLSNKEIAAKLHMSVDTERTHMMNILEQARGALRIQALLFAARHGLVEDPDDGFEILETKRSAKRKKLCSSKANGPKADVLKLKLLQKCSRE